MRKSDKTRSDIRKEAAKQFWKARKTKEPAYEHTLYYGQFIALQWAQELLRIRYSYNTETTQSDK
jgi:hypothetical protein